MPYIKETCVAGRTIEVRKYYSWHIGKHWERRENCRQTPEAQKRANRKNAERNLRRLLNANFRDGEDCLVTLDIDQKHYPEEIRKLVQSARESRKRLVLTPEQAELMKDTVLHMMQKFIRRLRRAYKAHGLTLKYVYCIEVGRGGAFHVHMVLSDAFATECKQLLLWQAWTYGGVHVEALHTEGQYARIASYFVKYAEKTAEASAQPEGSEAHVGKLWYPSRNLIRPEPRKEVVPALRWREEPKPVKGYVVDKSSIWSGISELTGLPYMEYTMLRAWERDGRRRKAAEDPGGSKKAGRGAPPGEKESAWPDF